MDRTPLARETLLVLPLTVVTVGPDAVNAVAVSLDTLYCPVTLSFSVKSASEPWAPLRVIAVDLPTASFTLVPVPVLMVIFLFPTSIVWTVPFATSNLNLDGQPNSLVEYLAKRQKAPPEKCHRHTRV